MLSNRRRLILFLLTARGSASEETKHAARDTGYEVLAKQNLERLMAWLTSQSWPPQRTVRQPS